MRVVDFHDLILYLLILVSSKLENCVLMCRLCILKRTETETNGRQYADIFKSIFFNRNRCILIKKNVPLVPINNKPVLVLIKFGTE